MIKSEKLKSRLVDMVKAGREATPEFTEIVDRLATAIHDEREGLKTYRVEYVRHVQQCGVIWVKATDEGDARDVAQEVLNEYCAEEDERVIRFDDAEEEDGDVSFDVEDAEEADDAEEGR